MPILLHLADRISHLTLKRAQACFFLRILFSFVKVSFFSLMISFSASSSVNLVSSLFILSDSVLPSIHFPVITSCPLFILEKSSETSSTGPTELFSARFESCRVLLLLSESANSEACSVPVSYLTCDASAAACFAFSLYSSGRASPIVAFCHIFHFHVLTMRLTFNSS
jgi:hypothetical protein